MAAATVKIAAIAAIAGDRRDRGDRGDRGHRGESVAIPQQPGVTLGDMLKDAQKSALQK
ncbi:MAG: hypothetical protein IPM83_05050 [Ignavibacteria bacterium]|nr:hypothetical protein [Ignavibacteria bacterium]